MKEDGLSASLFNHHCTYAQDGFGNKANTLILNRCKFLICINHMELGLRTVPWEFF